MTRVMDLKPGQIFRINRKLFELIRNGNGAAYVKEMGTEKKVKLFEGTEKESEWMSAPKKYTIGLTSEVDELL